MNNSFHWGPLSCSRRSHHENVGVSVNSSVVFITHGQHPELCSVVCCAWHQHTNSLVWLISVHNGGHYLLCPFKLYNSVLDVFIFFFFLP